MPTGLSKAAARVWRTTVPALIAAGVPINRLDLGTLGAYCTAVEMREQAERDIAARGFLVDGPAGRSVPNPSIKIERQASEQVLRLATALGLTPSSRQRIKTVEPVSPDNPWDQL
jgi:P27 family predicted phage terminase small subunit